MSCTNLGTKLLNVMVSPGEVFEEVKAAPVNLANWLVPTVLAGLSGLILLGFASTPEHTAAAVAKLTEAAGLSATQTEILSNRWQLTSQIATCLGAFCATFWSAFVLWVIGRLFLKSRFSFLKTLEVVGLTGMILVLCSTVTALLISALGEVTARPALSLLSMKSEPGSRLHAALDVLNFFHLWTATVLAIGLSKLSDVSFKEAAFWVFGWWVAVRLGLMVLT